MIPTKKKLSKKFLSLLRMKRKDAKGKSKADELGSEESASTLRFKHTQSEPFVREHDAKQHDEQDEKPSSEQFQLKKRRRAPRRTGSRNTEHSASLTEEMDAFSLYSNDSTVVGTNWNPSPTDEKTVVTPKRHLDKLLEQRGYEIERFDCLNTAYFNQPTPLQLASFHNHLLNLVKHNRVQDIREMLECGMSPNPRNRFGSSLLQNVCRGGHVELFNILLEHGCSLQVADEFGRTPLHDACFSRTPSFPIIRTILAMDPFLVNLADSRGHLALDYIQKEHFDDWIAFLDDSVDKLWPDVTGMPQTPNVMTLHQANTRPLPDPENALSIDLAEAVACGRLRPREASLLNSSCNLEDFLDEFSCNNSDDDDADDSSSSSWGAIDEEKSEDVSTESSYSDDIELLNELAAMKA